MLMSKKLSDKNPNMVKAFKGDLQSFITEAAALDAKPCPFCGSEALVEIGLTDENIPVISVRCKNCRASTKPLLTGKQITGETFTPCDRLQEAAAAWNRRTK